MSLFANRGRNTRIGKRRLPPKAASRPGNDSPATRRKLAKFAEAVANGASLTVAGKTVGIGQQAASKMFAKIRKELGWQAQ